VRHLARRMRRRGNVARVGFGTETHERMTRALMALDKISEEQAHARLQCIDRAPQQAEEGTRVSFVVALDPERVAGHRGSTHGGDRGRTSRSP
jgi:hypothetical protein